MTQSTSNISFSATTSSATALPDRSTNPGCKRVAFTIIPLTGGATITVAKANQAAVANAGIVLAANQPYGESNSEGFTCWQGEINIIGSAADTVAITEQLEFEGDEED